MRALSDRAKHLCGLCVNHLGRTPLAECAFCDLLVGVHSTPRPFVGDMVHALSNSVDAFHKFAYVHTCTFTMISVAHNTSITQGERWA